MTKEFIKAIKIASYDDEIRNIAATAMFNSSNRPYAEEILQKNMEPDEAREYLASQMSPEKAEKFRTDCARLAAMVH